MTLPIVASRFRHTLTDTTQRYECDVSGLNNDKTLWFSVGSTGVAPAVATLNDYALLSLIYPAMKTGQKLVIQGDVSGTLLYAAREDLQRLLISFDPSLNRIEIDAAPAWLQSRMNRNELRVGTGFSAGVDSFAALSSFRNVGMEDKARVTDLFVMNVGAFGSGMGGGITKAFNQSVERMNLYATETHRNAHKIDSNLQLFYSASQLTFGRTHSLRNLAAAALFHNTLDLYLYASGVSYTDIQVNGAKDIAYIDPILIPMLSPIGVRFIGANPSMSRIEKTRLIASDDDARRLLDVCVAAAGKKVAYAAKNLNCSDCSKCFRTMLTLDALGKLDQFDKVFDVQSYRSRIKGVANAVKKRGQKGSPVDMAAYEAFMASEAAMILGKNDG